MSVSPAARMGRSLAIAACLATGGAIVLMIATASAERSWLVVVIAVALLWGLGGAAAVALIPTNRDAVLVVDRAGDPDVGPVEDLRIGTLMHLGQVPHELARMTSASANAVGPAALVVPPGAPVPDGLVPGVVVVASGEPDADDRLATFYDECDAVLVTSARAFPTGAVSEVNQLLVRGAAWVQGRSEPLNRDRFGPRQRDEIDAGLRAKATGAGLWCWESDATVVRTSLLATHPRIAGHPWGRWLRERVADGLVGGVVDTTLTRRAAPVSAEGYWPDTTARHCAGAADLSDALSSTHSGPRARAVAAGLLVRSLSGWSLLWWLVALVLLADGSPVRSNGPAFVALLGVALLLRWLAPRVAAGVRPAPLSDVVASLYSLPGSLSATFSAFTRRVRVARREVSTRPLVWLAMVATGAAASVVFTAEPGQSAPRVAAGVAAALLVMTWVFSIRSIVERSWQRIGFRVPLDLPADVGTGDANASPQWRVVDGGPAGFGLVGPPTSCHSGDPISVRVVGDATDDLVLHGVVASIRAQSNDRQLVGVQLHEVEPSFDRWATRLTSSVTTAPPVLDLAPVEERTGRQQWGRRVDRVAAGLVVGMSVAVALTLGLVLVGLQPLVVRSGSMEPTYAVGEVLFVASEQAGDLREGQVVTRFDAPEAVDSLTHRVRAITRTGATVQVETRGDANDTSERWSAPVTEQVGVAVASVPAIGLPLTAVRGSAAWAVAAGALVAVVIALLFRPRSRPAAVPRAGSESLK